MNAEQLRDAIGKIDDRFIEEAENYVPEHKSHKPVYIIASASAAVIALCTCIHFHNEAEQARHPEIDNSVVVTTSETNSQTDEAFTEAPVFNGQSTDTVRSIFSDDTVYTEKESTETTVTEEGYESSVPDAATVPEKTEAPSGNGGSSGEKTALTERQNEETKVSETEPAEIIHELLTVAPGTELTVSPHVDVTTETPTYIETVPVVVPSSTSYPSPVPLSTPAPVITSSPEPAVSQTLPRIYSKDDFPVYLKTSDGVKYERKLLITKGQAGKYIKTISLSDDEGNSYEVSEYSLRYDVSGYPLESVSDDQVSVFYFEREDEYLIYVKEP